jgi:GT2 family glycosyltransferase
MQTRTCVVTVNYKGAEDTTACVASLKESFVPVSIAVVDNTPNDPALEGALSPYPDIKLIRAPENLGFGRGNNLGIEWALTNTDSEFIFILNNDAMVEPGTLQRLELAMEAHPEAGIVAPRIVLAEDTNVLWYGGGEVDWRRGGGIVPGVLGASTAPLAMHSRHITFASGCAMLIRREVLEKIGGFDDRYFMYEEDLELCLRTIEHDWKIWYEPHALVMHKVQGSLRKRSEGYIPLLSPDNPRLAFYCYHIVRNRLVNMWLHARGRNRLVFTVYFFPYFFAKAGQFFLRGRSDAVGAVFKGWVSYHAVIRDTVRKRS